ncbi:potassium transporter Kup [Leptolyngbya sp. 7M]|uniref:potassium transporter Kup n=1 Tax=Leptolyngbya sp. 7M TaxID=2812896 RepID=UPI001B8BD976|nr:potassium transporter Kup [Leptolyngbya sp. 7M]QYO67046.1 potassium transporter Kup [Leptolyngbya sp. 7M]
MKANENIDEIVGDVDPEVHLTYSDVSEPPESPKGSYLALLSLGAIGVVYGDIGTSPLYAIRECFHGPHAISATEANVLGVLSLIFWALVIIISIKYLVFVLRADNHGEGGILSLAALATPIKPSGRTERWLLIALGIFGASLLYGDGVITPAISILGAMEGLSVATPTLSPFVMPITIAILVGLFLIQKRGTAGIGKIFGPFTLVWFMVIGLLGAAQIWHFPHILVAVSPYYGVQFFIDNGWHGFIILGSVFLVVTGGEALYADMGHFGRMPIRVAWFTVALPALLLNYFGQGALLLEDPATAENPFYNLAPTWAMYPLIALATGAAIIASQAIISGAFSLTRQAVQLGFLPRLKIQHTSSREIGQIYLPAVNWALMIGCIALVIGFRTSSNLAAAYGIAVTSTMVITTILFYVVARELWNWRAAPTLALCSIFVVIDLAFFGANIIKLADGGWFPLVLATAIFTVMLTWKKGRSILQTRISEETQPLEDFLYEFEHKAIHRVPGTAVFMNGNASKTPPALIRNLIHNKVLHEKVIFLTVKTRQIPYVSPTERYICEPLGNGFTRIKVYYGYMEDPDIPRELMSISESEFRFDASTATYFLGRETVISTSKYSTMSRWRERLFSLLLKNARSATSFFSIPPNRVVELGEQIEI